MLHLFLFLLLICVSKLLDYKCLSCSSERESQGVDQAVWQVREWSESLAECGTGNSHTFLTCILLLLLFLPPLSSFSSGTSPSWLLHYYSAVTLPLLILIILLLILFHSHIYSSLFSSSSSFFFIQTHTSPLLPPSLFILKPLWPPWHVLVVRGIKLTDVQ